MNQTQVLDSKQLRKLSSLQPLRSTVRIFFEFAVIFALIGLQSSGILSIWFFPVTLLLIASRQHALLILMHEGSHYRLSSNRSYNEILGSLIGWNFFASFHGYQRHHGKHHELLKLNTMEDPDWARKQNAQWAFPMARLSFLKLLVRDVFLLNTPDYVQEAKDANNNKIVNRKDLFLQGGRILYAITLLTALIYFGLFKIWLLYWVLPIFTTLKAILRIRAVVDHFCTASSHPLAQSRTVLGSGWDKLIFSPCSIAYHGVHHLYPSIPYYNLKRAHHLMMGNAQYAEHAHVSQNYWTALNECFLSQEARA